MAMPKNQQVGKIIHSVLRKEVSSVGKKGLKGVNKRNMYAITARRVYLICSAICVDPKNLLMGYVTGHFNQIHFLIETECLRNETMTLPRVTPRH